MNELPLLDRRIPADMKAAAMILDISYPPVKCPACGHKTRGRLYLAGSVKICAGCHFERPSNGKKLKRVR